MYPNKRAEKRQLVTVPVQCQTDHSKAEGPETIAQGITVNISDSGICLYTHRCLEAGMDVLLLSPNIWERPKKASVRWCRQVIGGLYRVGMTLA